MANVAQGVTVTWGGTALGEVVSLSVDGITSDVVDVTPRTSTSRDKFYSPADRDLGTISVTARGGALMVPANVGLTAALSISGPGVSFTFTRALFESLGWTAAVGDLQTYTVTFKAGG